MLLLKDLGQKETTTIDNKTGKLQKRRYGLYECPVCKETFERPVAKGSKQKTCKKCRGTQNVAHGMAHTPMYKVWQAMKARCSNPNHRGYHRYGGRGITIDPKWETFEGYWEDMGILYERALAAFPDKGKTAKDTLSLDRIDGDKGYNKGNCQWITQAENSSDTCRKRAVTQNRVVLKPNRHHVEISRFESAKAAADELGLIPAHITATCKGKRKTHGGFNWEYTDET